MSLNGSDEAPSGNEILSKKKRSRAAYKGNLSKLEKDITMFLDEFVPGNLLHISKLKSYKNNVAEQNEQIKRLNNEILELVQAEEFDREMNSAFLFNDKIHDLVSRIETCLSLPLQLIQQFPMLVTLIVLLLTHRTKTILMLNFQKKRHPSLTVNRLSAKVFGISFLQPFLVNQIYPTLLNFLI